jgi:hypothetical protein
LIVKTKLFSSIHRIEALEGSPFGSLSKIMPSEYVHVVVAFSCPLEVVKT